MVVAKPCCLFSFQPLPQQGPSDPAICVAQSRVPSQKKSVVTAKRWCPPSTGEILLPASLGSGRSWLSPRAMETVPSKP